MKSFIDPQSYKNRCIFLFLLICNVPQYNNVVYTKILDQSKKSNVFINFFLCALSTLNTDFNGNVILLLGGQKVLKSACVYGSTGRTQSPAGRALAQLIIKRKELHYEIYCTLLQFINYLKLLWKKIIFEWESFSRRKCKIVIIMF